MRIHTDKNGVYVNAISQLADGTPVEGHVYTFGAGTTAGSIEFQRGPVKENGVNGLTNEALLAVVLHRLGVLNRPPYNCRENALAITKIEEALHWLDHRTKAREVRGVEGTQQI